MIGSPGETRKTIRETIDLMKEIQPDVGSVNPGVWILPDTELHSLCLENGLISEEKWLSSDETFIYTVEHSKDELISLARQFERGMAFNRGVIQYLRMLLLQMLPDNYLDNIRKIIKRVTSYFQQN
jgi:radical SAM superfamily enzyme YgiQ (UPF0313 family)